MRKLYHLLILSLLTLPLYGQLWTDIQISQEADTVNCYDFYELTLIPDQPSGENPFTDVIVYGEFTLIPDGTSLHVDGFCDSQDGSVFKIRFMPDAPGDYQFTVTMRQGEQQISRTGQFTARSSDNRGILRLDTQDPTHFIWEGTGEHYFWNGITTYYLMGWQSDEEIQQIINRLSLKSINRIRVLLYGRNEDRPWGQPVKSTDDFKLYLNPWVAQRPDNVSDPGFDLQQFNVAYWQRYESMLRYAQERDVIVSVIFFIGGQVLPTPFAAYSEDEIRYYRYGLARLAAFSNVTWDLGNEHNFHRNVPDWANWMGPQVKQWDPYGHLTGAHNVIYRSPGKTWNDIQMIQQWDFGQNPYLLSQKNLQALTGRSIPQIIEEYGYEDLWEDYSGQRSADTRRRIAWEIAMAGCYQTTGETALRGTGFSPDGGGGWVNGRGDDAMTMLGGYKQMVDFFEGFDWWLAEPHNELVSSPALCLAEHGKLYIVYLPESLQVTMQLEGALSYHARLFDPVTGNWYELPDASGPQWTSPSPPAEGDWVLILTDPSQETCDNELVISEVAISGGDQIMPLGGTCRQLFYSASPYNACRDTKAAIWSSSDTAVATVDQNGIVCAKKLGTTVITLSLVSNPEIKDLITMHVNPTYILAIHKGSGSGNYFEGEEVAIIANSPSADSAFDQWIGDIANITDIFASSTTLTMPGEHTSVSAGYMKIITESLVVLPFDENSGTAVANLGTIGGTLTCTSSVPVWTNNTPNLADENTSALDFRTNPGDYVVESETVLSSLGGLSAFTIAGWVNCKSNKEGSGGNRIVSWINHGGDGVDLVYKGNGSLQVGIDQWPDDTPAISSAGKVTTDSSAQWDNWVFFAVTYNGSQVSFYFGDTTSDAVLDRTVNYNRGLIGTDIGTLAIGHFNSATRSSNTDRIFRGLIDQITIHNNALLLSDIVALQNKAKS